MILKSLMRIELNLKSIVRLLKPKVKIFVVKELEAKTLLKTMKNKLRSRFGLGMTIILKITIQ